MSFSRLKNRTISKLTTRYPSIAKKFNDGYKPMETESIPWTPMSKPLAECRVAIVTSAGIHHLQQPPFDMYDRDGDPTFRAINRSWPIKDLMITHDYYDHKDADKDINIVFPIQRLKEFEKEGFIGEVAGIHYGFMGHINGRHIETLINRSAPKVAERIKKDNVDIVLLTPG